MSTPQELVTSAGQFNWWIIPKLGMLFLLVVFILFGILVLRQIQLMEKVVAGTTSQPLRLLAWFGLGLGILVFVLALLVL